MIIPDSVGFSCVEILDQNFHKNNEKKRLTPNEKNLAVLESQLNFFSTSNTVSE